LNPDFTFVVNPRAARGKGAAVWHAIQSELNGRGIRYEHLETKCHGDATPLARDARGGTVVSVGGDGTINEVLNGIIGNGRPLGVIPAGSGNDFIKSVGIPFSPPEALDALLSGRRLKVDAGVTYIASGQGELKRYFCNGVGIGFDAEVAARTREVTRFQGIGVYILAVLKTLGSYNAPEFRLEVDGIRHDGRKLLIAIGNGPCAGGGFYLTPRARVTDGVLDICAIDAMGTLSILGLMPRVMKGKHLALRPVRYLQGRTIRVGGDRPFSVHADGEMAGLGIDAIRIEVVPGAVELVGGGRLP
jgi:diacylglycerol kinase (ATP)